MMYKFTYPLQKGKYTSGHKLRFVMLTRFLGALGHKAIGFLQYLSSLYTLFRQTLYWIFITPWNQKPIRWHFVFHQMEEIGIRSIPIVFLVSYFIGVILALQTASQLRQLGAVKLVGALVGVALIRELGPLMTAVIVTGRVGASFTATLGTMKVSDEILALEVMAINPVGFLIRPRFIAMLVMFPCLTILANLFGIGGGLSIGMGVLGIHARLYLKTTLEALVLRDLFTGLIKSVVFAIIITINSCYQGFIVEGGAEGVGRFTMLSVVTSLVTIILADFFFTTIFFYLF